METTKIQFVENRHALVWNGWAGRGWLPDLYGYLTLWFGLLAFCVHVGLDVWLVALGGEEHGGSQQTEFWLFPLWLLR